MDSAKRLKDVSSIDEDMRMLIGIIADEETTTGFLLAGVGESFDVIKRNRSFLMVTEGTYVNEVQNFFISIYSRANIGVILVASDLWKHILPVLEIQKRKPLPIILEIETKSSLIKTLILKEQNTVQKIDVK
ncbi:V-type proton ATPase subunit F isoform X1 [Lucilia cuprina]|uniref:V-type proton ATPase subunit F isoform X1 n=1 Tax=Lucilia cuprina TaxID=7375 RepID=UPI001F06C68E|nr:V-type proton ATPase subunit F isoform X1 [Lucilia cuprina]